MTQIYIRENFIEQELIDYYLELAEKVDWEPAPGSNWDDRVNSLFNSDYVNSLPLFEKIQNEIRTSTGKHLYADTFSLVRWRVGDVQGPHADAEEPDGRPHPYPWREYACMLYLNDNFEGGEIYFPGHDIEIKPGPGLLAFFPGTLEYLHGVREITKGTRYTIANFWTTNYTKRARRYYNWRYYR